MLTFAYYLLKVIICSGILYGYYLLALKDKVFHSWNRFYLIATVILSLAAPLIKINIWQDYDVSQKQVIHLLQVVSTGDEFVYEYSKNNQSFHLDTSNVSVFIYTIVSGLLLAFFMQTLLRINNLKLKYQQTIIEGINFINTDAKGTPFSFFNTIFWNRNIDLKTSAGKQIFQHEVAHVHEKHTYDKIFMNIVLIIFWCNAVFWLIRKELNLIHEFIADKKAVEDSDTAAFATMILQATYPQHQFTITNNFFYSPLKRRLAMLTKNNNPKINYLSRLLVLPLITLVFFAFTLKVKTTTSPNIYSGKKINIIIDPGHGGNDNGAAVIDIKEKDLTLDLAKRIKELNTNENIKIILSREEDKLMTPMQRIDFAKVAKADLFISIHFDAELNKNNHSGIGVIIPSYDNTYFNASKILGSDIIESFKNNNQLPVDNNLKQRDKGVMILNANDCPAVLIEVGFLTTKYDLEYLIKNENQITIAKNILMAIEKYAQKTDMLIQESKTFTDSIPQFYNGKKIKSAHGSNKLHKAIIVYESGTSDTLSIAEAENLRIIPPPPAMTVPPPPPPPARTVPPPPPAMPAINEINKTAGDDDKIFTKAEVEASFPGGEKAWTKYITKVITEHIKDLAAENKSGTCIVKFIVHADGTVTDVRATTMQQTKLAEITINAISKGPKWIPAMQNGRVVPAYREQPVTFTISEN